MKSPFYFLLLFVCSISFLSCDDDDKKTTNPIDQLPPITQTGKNTFGCLINGEPFIVRNTSLQTAIYQGGILQIGANSKPSYQEYSFNLNIINPLQKNITYNIGQNAFNAGFTSKGEEMICIYESNNTFEGEILFSNIDNVNYIISGSFEFSTVNEACDTIKITNGRFDMQYIP